MQLNISTDYAIRAILYLVSCSEENRYATLENISESMKTSPTSLVRVLRKLRICGWVDSVSGVNGGYTFIGNPKEISLLHVLCVMEGTIKVNRCLETDHYCNRNGVEQGCKVRESYVELQTKIEEYLSSVTIAKLLE